MKSNKAQITYFIVFGIILIATVAIIFMNLKHVVSLNEGDALVTDPEGLSNVHEYLDKCFEGIVNDAIRNVSLNGGFLLDESAQKINFNGNQIPVFVDGDFSVVFPNKEMIENNLQFLISRNFLGCIDREAFEKLGLEILRGNNSNIKVFITDEGVVTRFNSDLYIYERGESTKLSDMYYDVPVPFNRILNISAKITSNVLKNSNNYNITQDCREYDYNNYVNIYIKEDIVQVLDFSTFLSDYGETLIFQFGIVNNEVVGRCVG